MKRRGVIPKRKPIIKKVIRVTLTSIRTDKLKEARKWVTTLELNLSSMYSGKTLESKITQVAWTLFSAYIRQRDFEKYGKCFTCNKRFDDWKESQAGHYLSRGKKKTLFNEINNHAQCAFCNHPHRGAGQPRVYAYQLNKIYGEGTSDKLYLLSNEYQKVDFEWYYDIAKMYYKKLCG